MTHPSYRPTSKWITKLSGCNSASAKSLFGSGHPVFYHEEDEDCLTASETKEIVDKLVSGPEAFMVWMTVVWHERAKELASKTFSKILQALPSLAPKETSSEKWLDIQGQIFLTIGDLCLKHNILTVSAAKACLDVALMDLPRWYRVSYDCDAAIRYMMALGVMTSKLACRLKFTKSYKAIDEKAELKSASKLKNLEI